MGEKGKYLLVEIDAAPDVFRKVVQAKQLLARGEAKTLSEATKQVDLSRSAFYKYKDSVFLYENDTSRGMATITAELVDEAGVLSALLAELSAQGANIQTIHQNIPVDGVAPVSISLRTEKLRLDTASLLEHLQKLEGVVNIRMLSG